MYKTITWTKKLRKGRKNGKMLVHCKVANEDAQDSCEDAMCFKSYFLSRNS
jgi:hypothetical protein